MTQTWKSFLLRAACAIALGLANGGLPQMAVAEIAVSITLAPPALPVYEQPVLAEEGAIWTPGYWDYGPDGYFWVPGTWVMPPEVGLLWTPGYWAWGTGVYGWNAGYWGKEVGFYGGVNYGFGYFGHGYSGGRWQGRHFFYNSAVSRVEGGGARNVYAETVARPAGGGASYTGGTGGLTARPTAAEQAAANAPHRPPTAAQDSHRRAALSNHALLATANHGTPALAATTRPLDTARAEPRASTAPAHAAAPAHASELPVIAHRSVDSSGDADVDRARQREQDALSDAQEHQRQALATQQSREHAEAASRAPSAANRANLEETHRSQTQALVQRHASEQQQLHATQSRPAEPRHDGPTR
jgi:hypothetical protein